MILTRIPAIGSRAFVHSRSFVCRSSTTTRHIAPLSLTINKMAVVRHTPAFVGSTRLNSSGSFSMDVLKDLRALSDAPIVECKKALQQSNNDITAAMDWLREHGAAKASSKLQGRETSEGLVGLSVSEDGKSASIVKLAAETDFAGRSERCVDLVLNVAEATILEESKSGTIDAETILQMSSDGSQSVKDLLGEAIVAIRENLSFPNAIRLQSTDENGILVGYVHNRVDSTKEAGTAAAVVELAPLEGIEKGSVTVETLQSVGKKLAMHVVAARPQYLSPDDIPESVLEKEKEILTKQQEETGKPPEIVEKIVLGRLRKFYEGVCLTEQAHMIEDKNPKIGKFLESQGIELRQFETLSIS